MFGWSSLVIAAIEDDKAPKEAREILTQHSTAITDPKMLLDLVYVCRTRKCYDKRQVRVHFSVHPAMEPVLGALIKCFTSHGAKHKRGMPPKSGGAQELQKLLTELEEIQGSDV